jgi:hypothetical protein
MNQPDNWSRRAAGLLPAVPARDVLSTKSLDGSLQSGLAAAAYRLKEGESVWLSAPVVNGGALLEFVQYLHAVRLSGIHGEVRASWVNRPQMSARSDMVVWTRASTCYTRWRRVPDLGVQWVRKGRGQVFALGQSGRLLRTLLCSPGGSLTSLCDELARQARPFLHVVDLTPFGMRESAGELLDHLESFFPTLPVLVLTTTGDVSVDVALRGRRGLSHWVQTPGDDTRWLGMGEKLSTEARLIQLPDTRLEEPLVESLTHCRELKALLERHPQAAKPVLQPLYKVIRTLRSLVLPLSFYEQYMERQRRGGMYPILPLSDWLDRATRINLPTGQAEQTRDQVVSSLRAVFTQLQTGKSGKQQAVSRWLDTYVSPKSRCLLVTDSEGEAKVLRDWLFVEANNALSGEYLAVVGVSSARDLHRHLGERRYDRTLIVSPLWESDFWALSLANAVDWLAYPRECLWQQRVATQWSGAMAATTHGKLAWWQWETLPRPESATAGETVPVEEWAQCSGEYASYNTVICDIPDNPDWIADLMAPVPEPAQPRDTTPGPGEVSVVTEEGGQYRYYVSQQVYVLSGREGQETLESFSAGEIEVGQQLVEIQEDGGTEGLLELLLDYAMENSIQHKSEQKIAERWHHFVDHAFHRCRTLEQFHQKLASNGVTISIQQLKNWLAHSVIGPNNAGTVVPAMARLSGLSISEKDVRSVINAQSHMKGLHTAMGKILKRMALATRAGNTMVNGNAAQLIDNDILMDLVRVETVASVHHHPVAIKPQAPNSIEALLRYYAEHSDGKLAVTNNAYRSARQSEFNDLEQVENCLRFLINDLFEVYGTRRQTLEQALNAGAQCRIRFSGDTAPSTQGQFSDYQRTYKNRPVNIGKHLGIGTSRDPRRCFRLHFHWDAEDQQLVIHHAGRHLPTSQG